MTEKCMPISQKCRLTNSVTVSFNTTVEQMTKMSQKNRQKCLSENKTLLQSKI